MSHVLDGHVFQEPVMRKFLFTLVVALAFATAAALA